MTREEMLKNIIKVHGAESEQVSFFKQLMEYADNEWNNACIVAKYVSMMPVEYRIDYFKNLQKKS